MQDLKKNARSHGLEWPPAVEIRKPDSRSPFVFICEHATNYIPPEYEGLGLKSEDLNRHIALDIGASELAIRLSETLDAPACLATYSRLLIDLNRPICSAGSILFRSETTCVPGNRLLTDLECQRRAKMIFLPFHAEIEALLSRRDALGLRSIIVSIHSFTPVFAGCVRPWHAGILFAAASDLGNSVIQRLRAASPDLSIEANVPYVIADDEDFTIPVHGDRQGRTAILIEIRNDLIDHPDGIVAWADRLYNALAI